MWVLNLISAIALATCAGLWASYLQALPEKAKVSAIVVITINGIGAAVNCLALILRLCGF